MVTNDTTCPESHSTTVFSRPFFGTDVGCDCVDGGGDHFILPSACTEAEIVNMCVTVPPVHPINMGQLNGKRVCGKQANYNFVTAVRPVKNEEGNYECQSGYEMCGRALEQDDREVYETRLDNIICVSQEEAEGLAKDALCPITSISFQSTPDDQINNELAAFLDGYLKVDKQPLNAPLTSFQIGTKPCLDSSALEVIPRSFNPLEVNKESICTKDIRYIPIFADSEFKLTEYDILEENYVTDLLLDISSWTASC